MVHLYMQTCISTRAIRAFLQARESRSERVKDCRLSALVCIVSCAFVNMSMIILSSRNSLGTY